MTNSVRFCGHRIDSRSGRTLSGFTLLETLLALTLTTLLMTAIVLSTTLYAQYRYRGLEGARQAEILMGTIEDLNNDLRACYSLFESPDAADPDGRGAATAQANSTEDSFAQARVLQFSADGERPISFVGRANAILLMRQGTNTRFEDSGFEPRLGASQILWLAPGAATVRLPAQLDVTRPIERQFKVPTRLNPRDLALYRCSRKVSDSATPTATRITQSNLPDEIWDKNADVQRAVFRFFDGVTWKGEWNSHLQEDRLPLAIELQLTLSGSPSRSMRFVLGLPR